MQHLLQTGGIFLQLRSFDCCFVEVIGDMLLTFLLILAVILIFLVFIFLASCLTSFILDIDLFLAEPHDDEDCE